MPDDKFAAAISDAANAAQALSPIATHFRRELCRLLGEAIRLESECDRMVRAFKRIQACGASNGK
jgi:hypothetical protein